MRGLWTGTLIAVAALAGCADKAPQAYQGYAEGEFVRIAAPYAGTLMHLAVQRGAEVQAGAPLFALEQDNEKAGRDEAAQRLKQAEAQLENLKKGKRPAEIDAILAQREQARATLKLAQADFDRDQKLAASGYISPQKLDASRTTLERSQQHLKELEAQLAVARLAAQANRREVDPQALAWMTHYQERALNSVLPAGDSMVADFKYGSPYDQPSFANDNVLPQHQGSAIAEQLAQAGRVLLEAVPQAMRGTTLFTLDAMVDAQDQVWLLEMNSNPMVHPDAYPVMMARLYESAEQTMQPMPATTA